MHSSRQTTLPRMDAALARHLHSALLTGTCADITLLVPQWARSYALHRVLLVQAGFWDGLWNHGFEEATRGDKGRQVEVWFSDGNITRKAFDVCRYLEFAIGRGIGDAEDGDEDLDSAAVGMERVGMRYDPDLTDTSSIHTHGTGTGMHSTASIRTTTGTARYSLNPATEHEEIKKESPSLPLSSSSSSFTSTQKHEGRPRYFYGFAGDKIGEACVAWLCRWGVDILPIEEELAQQSPSMSSQELENRMANITLSTPAAPLTDPTSPRTLKIWASGGLPAEWVRAVISSDAFWVRNEMERYNFAKRVAALRAAGVANREKDGVADEHELDEETEEQEEEEYNEIFRTGIYYSHMTFEELSSLSTDINPSTGTPYVPLPVLQAALWAASDYQGRITAYRPDGTLSSPLSTGAPRLRGAPAPTSPAQVPKNGLAMSTREIRELANSATRELSASPRRRATLASHSSAFRSRSGRASPAVGTINDTFSTALAGPFTTLLDRPFWPVPTDNTLRIGDAVSQSLGFYPAQALPDLGPLAETAHQPLGREPVSADAAKELHTGMGSGDPWFGFASSKRTGREIIEKNHMGKESDDDTLWSRYEPFRFSVEFWGIDLLGEKERAYSHTVFHAGSYFNIYVQTIRKKDKGIQLGIYLHRQSMLEPVPFPSSSRAASIAARQRATGTDEHTTSLSWNASTPVVGASFNASQGSNPLSIHRTMSVTPVGSMPRSMSPTAGALSDDEGLGRRNNGGGEDTPGAEVFTDRYWSRPKRDETENQKGLNAPYRDPRKIAKVFFSISCASAMGTALTRFSSGPDMFTISQSWGWKSSSLRSQEYLSSSQPPSSTTNPPTSTSVTFADELDPYSSTLERTHRPRASRTRSGPILSHGNNSSSYDGGARPNLGERLDQGVLGWISDPIEPILDTASKNGESLKSGHEQWKHKDLRSLRATIVMGVI
ncbi:hypothetical protein QFC19_000066 [Naganishia cerealis]|uniref:Uncharacterized protein n=1 Tax=Naganishia cerealis TaxID=610337 RepID=A0ACC2WQ34_9TREE|nr:hypothetical protein QFC19_000066 [Naganishia cerealis]